MPRRLRRASEGYTLVEVVIATLLIAIMASSVFSIALSSKQTGGKAQRKLVAAQATKALTGALKNYVTAEYSDTTAGPNTANGTNTWSIETATVLCSHSGGLGTNHYALATGTHTLTGYLPAWFEAAPYSATIKYHVCGNAVSSCTNARTTTDGLTMPGVTVTVDWTEP